MSEDALKEGLLDHLVALRNCLLRSILSVLAVFLALFPFNNRIYEFFAAPLIDALPEGTSMISTGVVSPFLVPLMMTLFLALVIALPYVLFEIWRFVAPGLYRNEKRLLAPLVLSSTLLFYLGMAFAHFVLFNIVFGFMVRIAPESIVYSPDIQNHLTFALRIFLCFGIAFEAPILVFVLVRAGFVSVSTLQRGRGYVIVLLLVVAAILTPPDMFSQLLLAGPVWVLYEIGLLVAAKTMPREEEPEDEKGTATPEREQQEGTSA